MYKRLLFFVIIFCQMAMLHAQQITIAGRVTDEETQKYLERFSEPEDISRAEVEADMGFTFYSW